MSFIQRVRPAFAGVNVAARRQISTTPRCLVGGATRHNNDPNVLEEGKQDNIRRHQEGSNKPPKWTEEIASDAEAFVKSTRGEIDASPDEIARLQNATKGKASKQ